ncbi:metallophosphoesterase [Actinoplanes sp. NPDC051494]|uniref:metallophosphoesterase n=1 Tax=Actinoplanes sp. NPDC051494 TaxID=3363907 RepID=UPI003791327F
MPKLRTGAGRLRRHPWTHRLGVWAGVLLVSLSGVVIGTMLLAHSEVPVGPFRADMSITPSIQGGSEIDIPPLGSLHLDSHDGPIHLKVDLGSLDQERTEALIDDPTAISAAGQSAVDDVTKGVLQLGLRSLGAAIVCALILSALIFRKVRRVAAAGTIALVVTGGSLGLAVGTIRPDSISEPRYEGLLVNAPAVVGDARRIADNYGRYADQLSQIVSNVSRIYTTVSSLPVQPAGNTTRILHVSDLHLNLASWGVIKTIVKQWDIDAIVDTGDIVDWGSSAETTFVNTIGTLGIPYIYVRGNHDSSAIQAAVARQKNAVVLDNSITTVKGLTIAGIGDPEFTPDKSETPAAAADDLAASPLVLAGEQLNTTIQAADTRVGVAMVHDPAMAPPLAGTVPLVLAGHTHKREVRVLPAPEETTQSASPAPTTAPQQTTLMIEGSTGGAGLRGLEKQEPTPLQMSVLYFDENQSLKAYDDIQLGGTGQSNVELQRNVVGAESPVLSPSVAPTQ